MKSSQNVENRVTETFSQSQSRTHHATSQSTKALQSQGTVSHGTDAGTSGIRIKRRISEENSSQNEEGNISLKRQKTSEKLKKNKLFSRWLWCEKISENENFFGSLLHLEYDIIVFTKWLILIIFNDATHHDCLLSRFL